MSRRATTSCLSHEGRCVVCGSQRFEVFFEMREVPVYCNMLWPDREAARHCPRGDIELAFCRDCSFITNIAFDPAQLEYTQAYENTLHFSPYFQRYAQLQARRLIKAYDLYGKDILEIGCGRGDFLLMLCELGDNRGIGFDPTHFEQENRAKTNSKVRFFRDYYSEKYNDYQADLVVCRHVLEHIQNPTSFLRMVREAVGTKANTHMFFEVPNALSIFQRLFLWDIIYEHCSYFTHSSLLRAFASCGFHVEELTEEYQGQFLCLDAVPCNQQDPRNNWQYDISQITHSIESFKVLHDQKVVECRSRLKRIQEEGNRAVVWGAGSKGVTFLNAFRNIAAVEYAVDINPRKQGMYVPGTGQEIVPPSFLESYQPDIVIVMNPVYKNEIRDTIAGLDLTPIIISI